MFFNEVDLLELRLKVLDPIVDIFVITECTETFSGRPKEMCFERFRHRFSAYDAKIVYNKVDNRALEELRHSRWKPFVTDFDKCLQHKHSGRPPRVLHRSLRREINHRDAGVLAIRKIAKKDDILLLSDVDEIPCPSRVAQLRSNPLCLPTYFEMNWYMYWINNRVQRKWYGTVAFNYNMLEGRSLDMLRFASCDTSNVPGPVIHDAGWHFSYLGGQSAIQEKLKAMPYQGLRASISKILHGLSKDGWGRSLANNKDILLQNREFELQNIDNGYPSALFDLPNFIEKYSRSI